MLHSAHLPQRASIPSLRYVIERTAAAPTAHLRGGCGPVLLYTVLTAPGDQSFKFQDCLTAHLSGTRVYMGPLRPPLPTINCITHLAPMHASAYSKSYMYNYPSVASPSMRLVRPRSLRHPYILTGDPAPPSAQPDAFGIQQHNSTLIPFGWNCFSGLVFPSD
ncbi:hypothetical protein EDD16DRAFT_1083315 [Pisolithus croceorrhizus]|nr:hypothetical protein EDD16DRAFT_1083315 [Pisolithus croceorrhizus]